MKIDGGVSGRVGRKWSERVWSETSPVWQISMPFSQLIDLPTL